MGFSTCHVRFEFQVSWSRKWFEGSSLTFFFQQCMFVVKGSLDEKLPIYEQDPKSKRLDSFEKRFVRD